AICGAAAVLAAEPIVRAQPHRVSIAVATVVVFGTLGMFLYPVLYPHLGLSPQTYGIYAGSTIHEVAQVVAAGKAVSDSAAAAAVIEKMLRVMLLAPFLLLLSRSQRDAARPRVTIPWFALCFLGVCAINSLNCFSPAAVSVLNNVDTLLLATAMAALGLRTHVRAVTQAGLRPLMLAGTLFSFLILGGYVVNRTLMSLLA
ncbi:MAG TPA: putative sulfate exporter family transporter, partial [Steroidobacteraceae bacterium]|nr:putative sulfate exporter family transporter [Steroidobacteraceae bacterium]